MQIFWQVTSFHAHIHTYYACIICKVSELFPLCQRRINAQVGIDGHSLGECAAAQVEDANCLVQKQGLQFFDHVFEVRVAVKDVFCALLDVILILKAC